MWYVKKLVLTWIWTLDMLWNWFCLGFGLWIWYKIGFGLDLDLEFGNVMKLFWLGFDFWIWLWIWMTIQDINEIEIDFEAYVWFVNMFKEIYLCLNHVCGLLNGICFMYASSMVTGGPLGWLSRLRFHFGLERGLGAH